MTLKETQAAKTETTYDVNENPTLEEVTEADGKILKKTEWTYDADGALTDKNRDHVRFQRESHSGGGN